MLKFRRSRALAFGLTLVLVIAVFSVDYTIKQGDTLGQIARDQGVSLSDLIETNGISNPDLIYPGQKLTIPGSDEVYTVVKGDTLDRIAGKYATTVPALAEANNIPNPNLIIIGQQLLIPSGNQAKSTSSPAKGASADTISGRSGKKHIVKPGDTLESIAAQYDGVTADQIAKANGIVDGDVHTGQALYLGGPGYVATGTKGETTYQVRPGDRLSDIASSHGISTAKLASLNGVSDPNLIRAGQVLTVPTGNAWVCPVEGASFMNDWGFPRDHGARYHEGTDLFADRGAEVLAPVSGTVTQKSGTIGGLQFSLDGSDGVRYIGSHMSKYGKAGKVNAGDVIGYVGATGNAFGTPPHLHFGIYYKGTPVNPFPTLLAHGCK